MSLIPKKRRKGPITGSYLCSILNSILEPHKKMRSGAIWAAILAASVRAAPAFPSLELKDNSADALQKLSDYFNLIAAKIQDSRNLASAPSCDLSKARMPAGKLGVCATQGKHHGC